MNPVRLASAMRVSLLLVTGAVCTVAAAGCGTTVQPAVSITPASASATSPSSVAGTSTSASRGAATPTAASSGGAGCDNSDVNAALATVGATLAKYNCADVGGTYYAGVRTSTGATYFLRAENGVWTVQPASTICGTASAGFPAELLGYC